MERIRILFDYTNGPVWKNKFHTETGELSTGIPCVDNDKELQILNDEASRMYSSLYAFNNEGRGCQFDHKRFEQMKPKLLSLVQAIIARLDIINDGSYVVIDEATIELK